MTAGAKRAVVRLSLVAALIAVFVAGSAGPADAQIGGRVAGTVRDDTGAIVPGATVVARNLETGLEQQTVSNSVGLYQFPNLSVGRYMIRCELVGFQGQTRPDVAVTLAATTTVEFVLTVGQVAESVTVTGIGETLSRTSSQLDTHVDAVSVVEVPALGRDVQSLALLAPGVTPTGAGVSGSGVNLIGGASNSFGQVGASFSSNGQRARANNFQVDGIDNNDPARSGGRLAVSQDAVQELVLIQNNFSAEYGRTTGAILNLITKSGTNTLRGSGFWFVRDEQLNALSNLDASQRHKPGFERPKFNFNQVGGTAGGPIRRDKTFFFGAYQYQRIDSLAGTSQIFVPTAAGLEALQRQVAAGQASAATVNLLRQNVPVAAASTRSSIVNGQPVEVGAVVLNSLFKQHDHNVTLNTDHSFNVKDNLRARFNYDDNSAAVPGALPQFGGTFTGRSALFSLTEVHLFSPSTANEFRFGFSRSNQNLAYDRFDGLAEVSIRELGVQIGPQTNGDKIDKNTNYQFVDNLNIGLGKHFLKTGIDVRHVRTDEFALFRQRGQFIFNSFQDFATNTIRRGSGIQTFGPGLYKGRSTAFYTYVQDDFTVRPDLTLNLGVRYEIQTLPGDGYFQELNAEVQSPVFTFGRVKKDTDNIAPRVGFAWNPKGLGGDRTVIRGGWGISYDIFSEIYGILQLPPEFQQTVVNTADVSNFLPTGLVGPPLPATPAARRARNLGGVPSDLEFPESRSWTIGVQRELPQHLTVEAKYVGTRGKHLPVRLQLNSPRVIQPLPQFDRPLSQAEANALPAPPAVNVARPDPLSGLYTVIGGFGKSSYHGGQFSVSRRFIDGLSLSAAYTYSRFLDDASEPLATTFATPIFPQDFDNLKVERGRSLYDRPHRFVSSFVARLPFDKLGGGPAWLTGDWQISGVVTVQSGQVYTALNGIDSNGDNQSGNDRVNFNPSGAPGTVSVATPVRNSNGVVVAYFNSNPNARFQQLGALTGLTGNIRRNSERTDTTENVDLVISKRVPLSGRANAQFRLEVFDLFNTRQYGIPTDNGNAFSALTNSFATVSSPNFGRTDIGGGSFRVLQLGLRVEF